MTAKNIKSQSLPGDTYFTPRWCVEQCLELVVPRVLNGPPQTILEPGAGRGVFVDALNRTWPRAHVTALDIDGRFGPWGRPTDESFHADFLDATPEEYGIFDLSIGNPPYTYAREFCERSFAVSECTIFLLRQGFMSSADRADFFQTYRPHSIYILANRPGFKTAKGNTDTADYCWIAWKRGYFGRQRTVVDWLPPVPLDVRRATA